MKPLTMQAAALVVAIAVVALLFVAPVHSAAPSGFAGEWTWEGAAGWQTMELRLKGAGSSIFGAFLMGPDSKDVRTPADYWRYFFEPAEFPIANVKVAGNQISFELHPFGIGVSAPQFDLPPNAKPDTFVYTGTLDGDRIAFTREWSARPMDRFELGNHKAEFTMVRLGSTRTSDTAPAKAPPVKAPSAKASVSVRPPVGAAAKSPTAVSPVVALEAAVTDAAGQFIVDLKLEDFQVFEDGISRPIQKVDPVDAARNYLLLFDHNLTWLDDDTQPHPANYVQKSWSALFGAAAQFLARVQPNDFFSTATFEEKLPAAVPWRRVSDRSAAVITMDVTTSPDGVKDLYGAISAALRQAAAQSGAKNVILFTDGRDGRFSPKWLRNTQHQEVLDPLFGLADRGEQQEFENLLTEVSRSGVHLYFIAINTDRDPEFGPALVGRRISGLFPGADKAIANYVVLVRSRMEALAKISGGRVMYGDSPADAVSLYQNLDKVLATGRTYNLEFLPAQAGDDDYHAIEIRIRGREDLRVYQSRAGYFSR